MAGNLKWRGPQLLKLVNKACRIGINKTMGHAAELGKRSHPFKNITVMAEKSIRISCPAVTDRNISFGLWGSVDVEYFIHLELGMGKRFATLIPVSKVAYPLLAKNITMAFGAKA